MCGLIGLLISRVVSPKQNNTTYIAAGIGAGVGLCALVALVIFLVVRRRKANMDATGKRETIAFENPTVR